jgi:hypothetical protein
MEYSSLHTADDEMTSEVLPVVALDDTDLLEWEMELGKEVVPINAELVRMQSLTRQKSKKADALPASRS